MISIKFLPVTTMLYKTKNGRYQVLNRVPSALTLRFTEHAGTIEHGASFQLSPKINRMVITRLICIQ